jgi:hypothetical protein
MKGSFVLLSSRRIGDTTLPVIASTDYSLTLLISPIASIDKPYVVNQNLKFVCSSLIFEIKSINK